MNFNINFKSDESFEKYLGLILKLIELHNFKCALLIDDLSINVESENRKQMKELKKNLDKLFAKKNS